MIDEIKEINRAPGLPYMTFSLPYDEKVARLQFESRYGYIPEVIEERFGKYLMLGPAPELEIEMEE